MLGQQAINADPLAKAAVMDNADAANGGHIIDFMLCELVDRLVGGDAIFVQATCLGVGIMDNNLVPLHRKPVRAGKAGRASPDDRNALSGIGGARKILRAVLHGVVRCMALQQTDLHRLALGRLTDTGLFTQCFGRADPGTHSTQNILVEDGAGRTVEISGGNLTNEFGDIDRRRAGGHTGRIIAKITSICRHCGFMRIQRWMRVREILFIGITIQTPFDDAVFEIPVDHACLRLHRR